MSNDWSATVLTLFPDMFPGPLGVSLLGKALAKGISGRWTCATSAIMAWASTAPSTTRRPAAAPAW